MSLPNPPSIDRIKAIREIVESEESDAIAWSKIIDIIGSDYIAVIQVIDRMGNNVRSMESELKEASLLLAVADMELRGTQKDTNIVQRIKNLFELSKHLKNPFNQKP